MTHCLASVESAIFHDRFLLGFDNGSLAVKYQRTKNHVAVILHGAVKKVRICLEEQGYRPG
jgi:hypothetical protein